MYSDAMVLIPMQNNPASLYNNQSKIPKHETNRFRLTLVLLRLPYLPSSLRQVLLNDIFPRNVMSTINLVREEQ